MPVIAYESNEETISTINDLGNRISLLTSMHELSNKDDISLDEANTALLDADLVTQGTDVPSNMIVSMEAGGFLIGDIIDIIIKFLVALANKIRELNKFVSDWIKSIMGRDAFLSRVFSRTKIEWKEISEGKVKITDDLDNFYYHTEPVDNYADLSLVLQDTLEVLVDINTNIMPELKLAHQTATSYALKVSTALSGGETNILLDNVLDKSYKARLTTLLDNLHLLPTFSKSFNRVSTGRFTHDPIEVYSRVLFGNRFLMISGNTKPNNKKGNKVCGPVIKSSMPKAPMLSRVQLKTFEMKQLSDKETFALFELGRKIFEEKVKLTNVMKDMHIASDSFLKVTSDVTKILEAKKTSLLNGSDIEELFTTVNSLNTVAINIPSVVNEYYTNKLFQLVSFLKKHKLSF